MRTEWGKMVKMMIGVFALMAVSGCLTKTNPDGTRVARDWVVNLLGPSAEQKEIMDSFSYCAQGSGAACIEKIHITTNGTLKVRDVYVSADMFWQSYRIQGKRVVSYRWPDYYSDSHGSVVQDGAFRDKQSAMWKTLHQLSSKLEYREASPVSLESDSAVIVTSMIELGLSLPSSDSFTWTYWNAWQWALASSEAPEEIDAFCQAVEQFLSAPEYEKQCSSYLRAVPLFTKEALDAERNTPVVKQESIHYLARFARRYPYLLIPMSGRSAPFYSIAKKYTPGDKFKVREEWDGQVYYYLIETFAGM